MSFRGKNIVDASGGANSKAIIKDDGSRGHTSFHLSGGAEDGKVDKGVKIGSISNTLKQKIGGHGEVARTFS